MFDKKKYKESTLFKSNIVYVIEKLLKLRYLK
jgi:hypothetical protein